MNEDRLIEIETKLAHQEILVSELNQVIAQQQETIDGLEKAIKKFFKQFQEAPHENKKPPHY